MLSCRFTLGGIILAISLPPSVTEFALKLCLHELSNDTFEVTSLSHGCRSTFILLDTLLGMHLVLFSYLQAVLNFFIGKAVEDELWK